MKVKNLFIVIFLFTIKCSFAQLTDFNLTVIKTDETCKGKASLTFEVANTTPGSTIVYSIFKLPDTSNPLAITNKNNIGFLIAGDYKVVANQSLGNLSNSAEQTITILDNLIPLDFTVNIEPYRCLQEAKVTINSTTAVLFEITEGPVLKPKQSSNIFENLPLGTYKIRIFNNCDEGIVKSVVVSKSDTSITISNYAIVYNDCDKVDLKIGYNQNTLSGNVQESIKFEVIVYPPNNRTPITRIFDNIMSPSLYYDNFPFFYDVDYYFEVKSTDICGNIYNSGKKLIHEKFKSTAVPIGITCSNYGIRVILINAFKGPYTVSFLESPLGFDPKIANENHPILDAFTFDYSPVLPGNYSIQITNSCGRSTICSLVILDQAPRDIVKSTSCTDCKDNPGVLNIYFSNTKISHIELTKAPTDYPNQLPYDYDINITSYGNCNIRNLTPGEYTFYIKDSCGLDYTYTCKIDGYKIITNTVNIIEGCNSFNVKCNYLTNSCSNSSNKLVLEIFNPILNQWDFINNIYNNNQNNNIFANSGKYRILYVKSGSSICIEEIYRFDFSSQPKIIESIAFSCNNGKFDAVLSAQGKPPLKYSITSKNGLDYLIDNGGDGVFVNLEPARYNFRIEDFCGNVVNREIKVEKPFQFGITPVNLCENLNGSLVVPPIPFLKYEWWKNDDINTILSTTNTLLFPNFTNQLSYGVYHVRISNTGNPNTCINYVLDYTIPLNTIKIDAGSDNSKTYCGSQGFIDLFTLMDNGISKEGNWIEVTESGKINRNIWDATAIISGNFLFQYKLTGLCDVSDTSLLNIIVNPIPQIETMTVDPIICKGQNIHFNATSDLVDATYNWTGPNNFQSNIQNPIIDNATFTQAGDYLLTLEHLNCFSESKILPITIKELPEFTLEGHCINNRFIINVSPSSPTFDESSNVYQWKGPNNLSNTSNSIDITKLPRGIYSLAVTNIDGCIFETSLPINSTFCDFQKGVSINGDDYNRNFDLSAFQNIRKLHIINRFGEVVYELDYYKDQWQGQDFSGNLLPGGTYYYKIDFTDNTSPKTGWIYLSLN